MKIVLLPGMDGTGELFEPFRSFLFTQSIIVALPQSGSQDYEYLANYVEPQLPNEDFIIVAESFSGPIAALLSSKKIKELKGIVFVATFLQCPNFPLALIAQLLPLKFLLKLPVTKPVISRFLLGSCDYSTFLNVLENVSGVILRKRLYSVLKLKPLNEVVSVRSLYLKASSDYLVSDAQIGLFKNYYQNIQFESVNGTHFLLQSNPKVCADIVNEFIQV